MIIRNKTGNQKKEKSANESSKTNAAKNIIKKEDLIFDTKNVENTNKEEVVSPVEIDVSPVVKEETFEKIDITSIDFKERIERRRGDRRRGYRRIDERSLVSRAQQEAHTIKELAAREGYKNGLDKAQKEIDEIKTSLIEFLETRDEMYEEFFPHVMEISMDIAKKIIKKEVSMSNDVLKEIVATAMDELNSDTQKVTIKVHSNDLEFASASLPEILEVKNKGVKFSFVADDSIEQGSCVLIANNGVIDANFKTQLIILQSAFGIYRGGI